MRSTQNLLSQFLFTSITSPVVILLKTFNYLLSNIPWHMKTIISPSWKMFHSLSVFPPPPPRYCCSGAEQFAAAVTLGRYIKPAFCPLNAQQEMKRNRTPLVTSKYATGNQCFIVIDAFHSNHPFCSNNRRYGFIRYCKNIRQWTLPRCTPTQRR